MKKNMIMHKGKMVPDYAVDGKGSGDLKKARMGMMNEMQMAQYGKQKMGKGGKVIKGASLRRCKKH